MAEYGIDGIDDKEVGSVDIGDGDSHAADALPYLTKHPVGVAIEDSKHVGSTIDGKPIHEVRLQVNRPWPAPHQVQNVGDHPISAQEVANIIGLTDGNRLMVELASPQATNPAADMAAARERIEKRLGWNPGGLDGCSIDSISPDSGDVLIIQYPKEQTACREAIEAAMHRVNLHVPCIVIPDEMIVESWTLAELRSFRDRLNEIIYDKEKAPQ